MGKSFPLPTQNSPELLAYAWQLKKKGRTDSTIKTQIKRLTQLSKLADLNTPEQVKEALAILTWKNITKKTAVATYNQYAQYKGLKWEAPKYESETAIPFIPTEQEIDQLIAASNKKYAALLQLLKETAARIGEALKIELSDIDPQRQTIAINHPEKHSNARLLPITTKLINMIQNVPQRSNRIFNITPEVAEVTFIKIRKRTATKLNNPRIKQIHFHTFRHWKATMLYHETRSIMEVKAFLGHKDIQSTMTYINLEQALFHVAADQWIGLITHNEQEELKAIETGFELVRDRHDGTILYRKRK